MKNKTVSPANHNKHGDENTITILYVLNWELFSALFHRWPAVFFSLIFKDDKLERFPFCSIIFSYFFYEFHPEKDHYRLRS